MKMRATYVLTEEYVETWNDDSTGTVSAIVDIDYMRKTFTVRPASFDNNLDFKFRHPNECYAMAELFIRIAALMDEELPPQNFVRAPVSHFLC